MRRKESESIQQQTKPSFPYFLSAQEVADILRIGLTKVYELAKNDGLPLFTLGEDGRERRVDSNDFNQWVEKQKHRDIV